MKFYIRTDGNDKVTRITNIENKDLIEIEDNGLVFSGQPLVYKNGKLAIDEDEIKHLEDTTEICDLQQKLADTDYVVIKIAEGVATAEDYADILKDRAEWRKKINELEKRIG